MNTALYYAAALVSLGLLIYAFFIEPMRVQISRLDISIDRLPESLDGFTICHLSDIHSSKYGKPERRLMEILSEVDADICLITGDLLRSMDGLETYRYLTDRFRPRLGVFAVPGNGEHRLDVTMESLSSSLAEPGIKLLVNENASLCANGETIHVIGVDDPFTGFDDIGLAESGIEDNGLRILLAHSPDILINPYKHSSDIVLAGHTHGGQVKLPFIGPIWLHCRYRLGISDGYYSPKELSHIARRDLRGMHMYVSRGFNGKFIRARFLCPPEVTIIRLRDAFRP